MKKVILLNLNGKWNKNKCLNSKLRQIGLSKDEIKTLKRNYLNVGMSTPQPVYLVKKGETYSMVMIEEFHTRYFIITNNTSLRNIKSKKQEEIVEPDNKSAVPGPNGFFI
jgi:hypothetical protein